MLGPFRHRCVATAEGIAPHRLDAQLVVQWPTNDLVNGFLGRFDGCLIAPKNLLYQQFCLLAQVTPDHRSDGLPLRGVRTEICTGSQGSIYTGENGDAQFGVISEVGERGRQEFVRFDVDCVLEVLGLCVSTGSRHRDVGGVPV